MEANVATTEKKFLEGSSSKTKFGASQMKKKGKGKTSKIEKERKLLKVNVTTEIRTDIS